MGRDRGPAIAIGVCSLALLVPLLQPLASGRVFVYNDLTWFHLPTRYLYQQALRAGDSVLWTPAIFSGWYLHGEGQVGVFHPLHLLLYGLLPLAAAFNLELIANYLAAFGGMAWFLRRLQFSAAAALFGAMLFAFCGFNLLHHHHVNMVAIVAHLPWLLAAADVLMTDRRPRRRAGAFAAVASILASELLLGFPQGVWWNGITLAAFAAYRTSERRDWRPLLPCAAALAVGVLLGGIQLLPSADTVMQSARAGAPRGFALTYSLHPLNVVQFWSPYVFEYGAYAPFDYPWFHEFGVYSGAVLMVALAWTWMRRAALPPPRRRLAAAVAGFAVVSLLLAFGRHGGLDVLLTYVPVLKSLRAPVRYIVLWQFALAILATIMFEDLLAIRDGSAVQPRGAMAAIWIPVALSAASFLLHARLLPYYRSARFASFTGAAPGFALVVIVTVLVVLAARRVRWAVIGLAVVTAIDLGAWGLRFVYREPPRRIEALTQAVTPPAPSVAERYVAAPQQGPFRGDLLVLKGYRLTSGYVALYPVTHHPLDSPDARRLSGTRWDITQTGERLPAKEEPAARARLLDETGRDTTGGIVIATDRPGTIVANVDAPGPRTVALTERFSDGWSATAAGRPVPTVRIEEDFLGCLVGPGVQRVEFHFMPRSFVQGLRVTAGGVVALAVGLVVMLRPPRIE